MDTFFTRRHLDSHARERRQLGELYEDLGYFVAIGAECPYTAWRSFGKGSCAYLSKPAIANRRKKASLERIGATALASFPNFREFPLSEVGAITFTR